MPKFAVTVAKTILEETHFEVEATSERTAEIQATAQAQTDEDLKWRWEETFGYDVIAIEELEPPKQAAE